jgi:hypothetical protein
MKILNWYIYEVTAEKTSINGVRFRGRLRKLGLINQINLLTENASDRDNCVRFALLNKADLDLFSNYIISIVPDANIKMVLENVANPVLSKIKVNTEDRYQL